MIELTDQQIQDAMIELHLCRFCHKKMEDVEMSIKYCSRCDAYKTKDGLNEWIFFFERVYKKGTYRFTYDTQNTIFTVAKKDRWEEAKDLIYKTNDLDSISPQNWSQKLPTLIVFS